ncbi:DUF937 domain-containing protein [Roseibium aggregatum]|uniref:DUF937 domain-containing protein n=1 Tax=Roseibium aggregatum TaxID=187304 RepID=A0A926S667_9HYPH|nr:DUF937 domain-containing protein [Roseibium aggregatum]MBD1546157.1 hypothetical protein [Roseibium aggregatum]
MADDTGFTYPFDLAAIAEDMQQRFGWSNQDLSDAMSRLMPAAMAGFRHFGPQSLSPFQAPAAEPFNFFDPLRLFGKTGQAATNEQLSPFFGPEFVRKAVAEQIAQATGLQQKAVQEMMPVAATLAMSQVVRPYLHSDAQELLDAFVRGFVRGRPKPVPKPMDYVQGYAEAVNAFWSHFLKPLERKDAEDDRAEEEEEIEAEPAADDEDAVTDDSETENSEPESKAEGSEFDTMMASWMAAGRDFQSSQFEAFDSFFNRAARDLGNTSGKAD